MIINAEMSELHGFVRGFDSLDVIEYSATSGASEINAPSPRCDTFGSLYMNFARPNAQLGEILIYLAALFILSDVVRYQVDQWARLLDDHPDEAIVVERFLDLAARKVPNLALSELERDFFEFRVAA